MIVGGHTLHRPRSLAESHRAALRLPQVCRVPKLQKHGRWHRAGRRVAIMTGDAPPLPLRAGWPVSILGSSSKPRPLRRRLLSHLLGGRHPTESAHARHRIGGYRGLPPGRLADQPLSGVLLCGANMIHRLAPGSRRQSRRRPPRELCDLCETWPLALPAIACNTRNGDPLSGSPVAVTRPE